MGMKIRTLLTTAFFLKSQDALSTAIFSTVVISLPMTQSLHVVTCSLLGLQIFNFPSDYRTGCDETAKEFTSFA